MTAASSCQPAIIQQTSDASSKARSRLGRDALSPLFSIATQDFNRSKRRVFCPPGIISSRVGLVSSSLSEVKAKMEPYGNELLRPLLYEDDIFSTSPQSCTQSDSSWMASSNGSVYDKQRLWGAPCEFVANDYSVSRAFFAPVRVSWDRAEACRQCHLCYNCARQRCFNEHYASISNGGKKRVIWTQFMERAFINAVAQLGDKATPAKILEYLIKSGVDHLTRIQVASHLQKYRERTRKSSGFKKSHGSKN